PEGYYSLELATNHYSLVCGIEHPLVKVEKSYANGIPDDEIAKYSFIDVFLDRTLLGASTLRQWVAPAWSSFKRCLITSYFLPCVPMLEKSKLVSILPAYTAKLLEERYRIKTLRTQTKLLTNKPRLIWHEVTNSDPLRQWIRSMIKSNIAKGNPLP
ncbi:MAG: hypothetical protein LUC43_07685, partial [Burkholderiales bacterium]|nr:hypothetical protein [Burkholderiales bacterium]